MREIDEYKERKGQLREAKAEELGVAEGNRLYHSDARLVRSLQEVVSGRNIEGVTLTDISPNAAWKEAVFRFRANKKMLPNSFCKLLAIKAWEKFVEFSLQRKPQLRIRIVVKFTYPNQSPDQPAGDEGDNGWVSTRFEQPASQEELEKTILDAVDATASYHDRDEITCSNIILTWVSSSGKGCSLEEVPEELRKKRSVILVLNNDNMCGQRALTYHLAITHGMKGIVNSNFHNWIHSKKNSDYVDRAVLDINSKLFGRKKNRAMEFQDFQKFTDIFHIRVVINMWNPGQRTHVIYRTDGETADTVHLLLQEIVRFEAGQQTSEYHYHYVRYRDALNYDGINTSRYCDQCKKDILVSCFDVHGCAHKCTKCGQGYTGEGSKEALVAHQAEETIVRKFCPCCNTYLKFAACVAHHTVVNDECKNKGKWSCFLRGKEGRGGYCSTFPKERRGDHVCGEIKCKCGEYLAPTTPRGQELRNHFCVIPALKVRPFAYNPGHRVFAWDIECNLTPMEDTSKLNRTNLVQHVPSAVGCQELRMAVVGEYKSWVGPTCMEEFWTWAKQQGPATFLAHNGKAYDTLILMKMVQHEFTRQDHPEPPVTRGNSILQLRVGNICFLDSMMHMGGSLARLPKTYGFEGEMRKGLIPYAWYSSFEKLNGPTQFLPDKSFYPPDKQDDAFHKWHDGVRETEKILAAEHTEAGRVYAGDWNPRIELEAYLKEDVAILAEACARHRALFLKTSAKDDGEGGIDPFCGRIVTLASACYKSFRCNFYDETQFRLPQWLDTLIRSGVAGGNCNSHRRRARLNMALAKRGYYIKHVDFTSEYPYCMLVNDMPCGKPEITTFDPPRPPTPEELESFGGEFFGYITADFEPPKDCIHPIIGKAEPHGPLLEWLGAIKDITITSMELKIALEEDYKITNIRHLVRFKRHTSFWTPYMRHFVRMKVESEDYTKMSEADLDELMFIYEKEFGIILRKEKLREPENQGLRAVAKSWINTIHGRWGMRLQQDQTAFVDPEKYNTMKLQMAEGRLDIKDFVEVNNEQGIVKSCETLLDDECRTLNEVNSALSLWVAACGRCMLHRELVKLGVRALYWDTDSVIYLHDPSPLAKNPKLGYHGPHVSKKNLGRFNVLGSLTDEMEGLCSLDFCAPRPKTYGYRYPSLDECKELNQSESFVGIHGRIDLERKKTLEKIAKGSKLMAKGFVQSSVTADDFNFDTLCQLVETGEVVKNVLHCCPHHRLAALPGGKGGFGGHPGRPHLQ